MNYYRTLLLMTLVPIGLVVVMTPVTIVIIKLRAGITFTAALRQSKPDIIRNLIALFFVVYTGVSAKIIQVIFPFSLSLLLLFIVHLQIFNCQDFEDGTSWLKVDYSTPCHTAEYKGYVVYAALMLVVYPIGLPLLTVYLIYKNR